MAKPYLQVSLGEDEIASLLGAAALIPVMEEALMAHASGTVEQPVRQIYSAGGDRGFVGLMPLFGSVMGLKLVTFYPGNADLGLPTHLATILLLDEKTGALRAVLDGRLITQMRTAAVSAVATKLLARADARTLAVLGSGVQAEAHVEALSLVRDFVEVRVWSRTPANALNFAERAGARAVETPEEAVFGADGVVTATAASDPILRGEWLKPGCHVNAVGWNGPESRELDDKAMQGAVVVDSRAEALAHSGNLTAANVEIRAELGELLLGRSRVSPSETTVFLSVGMAVEDLFAADLAVRHRAAGLA